MKISFYYALSFFTIIPLPSRFYQRDISPVERAHSIVFYGPVGAVMAIILAAALGLFLSAPPIFAAAVLLSLWVLLTGGLHLDGVADCSDALAVRHRDPSKVRQAIKEPQVGAMAVLAIALLLLLKFAALASLIDSPLQAVLALFFSCTFARLAAAVYMVFTPYVSERGLVSGLSFKPFQAHVLVGFAIVFIVLMLFQGVWFAIALLALLAPIVLYWRQLWIRIIGGYTGDCVGAVIELVECATLCMFVLFL